jgi:hypothetical protein
MPDRRPPRGSRSEEATLTVEEIAEASPADAPRKAAHLLSIAEASLAETEHLLAASRDRIPLSPAAIGPMRARTDRIARLLDFWKAAIARNC